MRLRRGGYPEAPEAVNGLVPTRTLPDRFQWNVPMTPWHPIVLPFAVALCGNVLLWLTGEYGGEMAYGCGVGVGAGGSQ